MGERVLFDSRLLRVLGFLPLRLGTSGTNPMSCISPECIERRGGGWMNVDYAHGKGSGVRFMRERSAMVTVMPTRLIYLEFASSRINSPATTRFALLHGTLRVSLTDSRDSGSSQLVDLAIQRYRTPGHGQRLQKHHTSPTSKFPSPVNILPSKRGARTTAALSKPTNPPRPHYPRNPT